MRHQFRAILTLGVLSLATLTGGAAWFTSDTNATFRGWPTQVSSLGHIVLTATATTILSLGALSACIWFFVLKPAQAIQRRLFSTLAEATSGADAVASDPNSGLHPLLPATILTKADSTVRELTKEKRELERRLAERTSQFARRHAELFSLRENSPSAIIGIDDACNITEFNAAAEELLGRPRSDATGKHLADVLFAPTERSARREEFQSLILTGAGPLLGRCVEIEAYRADDSVVPAELRVNTVFVESQSPIYAVALRDLSHSRLAERLERDRTLIFEMIAQAQPMNMVLDRLAAGVKMRWPAAVGMICLVNDGILKPVAGPDVSPELFEALQKASLRPAAVTGGDIAQLYAATPAFAEVIEAHGFDGAWCEHIVLAGGQCAGCVLALHASYRRAGGNDQYAMEVQANLAAIGIEHEDMTRRLARQATADPLTGLPSRLVLADRLSNAVALTTRRKEVMGLLVVDIDGFRLVNDRIGRQRSDDLLKEVARRLSNIARQSDTLIHMGGDDFALIAPNLANRHDAARIARRIIDALRPKIDVEGHQITLTASIGVAVIPDDAADADALLKNAEAALARAKARGRNGFEYFSPELNADANRRMERESDLRRAVERNELELHYQPQVDPTGRIIGVEALMRWRHPAHGLVPPMEFIPLAEETGLIVPMGTWALTEACRQAREWMDTYGRTIPIAVNVSAMQFERQDFVETVLDALAAHKLEPSAIELEMTESVVMQDTDEVARKLGLVRRRGMGVAIDDFGTGYSSLAYLHRLPLDTLKIDRSFIRDLRDDNDQRSGQATIVRAIASLAQSLDLRLIAEGVETEYQRTFLEKIGCRAMQGYFFARPSKAADLAEALACGFVTQSPAPRQVA